jgi:general secretion pathway protein G
MSLCTTSDCIVPRRTASRRTLSRFERGLTLIEIIIVVAIIGIVLSFLLKGVFSGAQEAKAKLTKAMLEQLKGDLTVYQVSNNQFPGSLQDIKGNEAVNDGFGNPIQYKVSDGGRSFELLSLGADGKPGGTGSNQDITLKGP